MLTQAASRTFRDLFAACLLVTTMFVAYPLSVEAQTRTIAQKSTYALFGVNQLLNSAQEACDAFYQIAGGQSGGHLLFGSPATCFSVSTLGCCFGNEGGGNIAIYSQASC